MSPLSLALNVVEKSEASLIPFLGMPTVYIHRHMDLDMVRLYQVLFQSW